MKLKSQILKKIITVALAITLTIVMLPVFSVNAAKKPKLNKKKVTIFVGKTVKLKVKNAKGKVKWKTSNRKVATVSKKGIIKGKKPGKATITAMVKGKKLKCRVTVKKNISKKAAKNTAGKTTQPEQAKKPATVPQTANPKSDLTAWKYYENEDGTFTITEYSGSDTDVSVPDQINGKNVTAIDDYAFSNNAFLRIVLPQTLESIGYGAFSNCYSLEKIVIPDSVTFIGGNAFNGCGSLMEIVIPEGVKSIESGTFQYCYSLKSVTLPQTLKVIDDFSFEDCDNLEKIVIPDGVTYISFWAFRDCGRLKSVTLSKTLESIGERAFAGCYKLEGIIIPESVTYICNGAFSGCYFKSENFSNNSSLVPEEEEYWGATVYDEKKEGIYIRDNTVVDVDDDIYEVVIPEGVTAIGDGAFEDSYLESITLPQTLENIGEYAFSDCGIGEITIPANVKYIGEYAFSDCGIGEITIPANVKYIGERAFSGCHFKTENFANKSSLDAEANGYWGAIVYDEMIEEMYIRNHTVVGVDDYVYNVVLPDYVTAIGNGAFENQHGLESIYLPQTLESIGECAFKNCESLSEIVIPESVTYIADNAFERSYLHIIKGKSGSYAETWAGENGFEFVVQ